MPATETSASYSPALPITASVSSVLSQDVLTTNTIPVDTESPSPVGPFVNPNSGGSGVAQVEALGLVTPSGAAGPLLSHIARNTNSPSGWVVTSLLGGITASEVMVGTQLGGQIIGFYIDSAGSPSPSPSVRSPASPRAAA